MLNVDRPATQRQMEYINDIYETLGIEFCGHTVKEASDFIDNHKDAHRNMQELYGLTSWHTRNGYF